MNSRIILALDGKSMDEVMTFVESLKNEVAGFKFNDALDQHAERVIGFVKKEAPGAFIWADIKAHDIPQTVANRLKKYAGMGVHWITVHASGGLTMMRYAVAVEPSIKIIAVSVLTSLGEDECNLIYGGPVKATVLKFALMAKDAGVWGLVSSAKELEFLRKHGITGIKKITPGVRPEWYGKKDDQKRRMTPGEAIKAGADYLVIGRPITQAEEPLIALQKINEEVARALAELIESKGDDLK